MAHEIPNCFGTTRMPHHRAEHCCNDCPFEPHCDRIEAQAAEIERLRNDHASAVAELNKAKALLKGYRGGFKKARAQ